MKITLKGKQGDSSFQILTNFRVSHYPHNSLRKGEIGMSSGGIELQTGTMVL